MGNLGIRKSRPIRATSHPHSTAGYIYVYIYKEGKEGNKKMGEQTARAMLRGEENGRIEQKKTD